MQGRENTFQENIISASLAPESDQVVSSASGVPGDNSCGETAYLLESCRQWIRRYVVLSSEQSAVIAAWVLHTWAIEAAECTPYLHITAPEKGCGKSRGIPRR